MWVNVTDLIRNRIPDRNGAIPGADSPSGTYEVRDLSPGPGSLTLAALALDSAVGYAGRPPSAVCCGLINPGWDPDEIEFFGTYGGSIDAIIQANDSCGGQLVNVTSGFNSWWSGNSAIAQVITQKVTAEATGTTTGVTTRDVWEGYGSNCSNVPTTVSTPITVTGPTINGILPGSGQSGLQVPVTINGTNFGSSSAALSIGDGITGTVGSVNSSGTQIGATFSLTGLSAGSYSFTVILSNGDGGGVPSNPWPFTVNPPPPTISSISPAQGLVGTPINVTIVGTGFASGATVSAGSNIAVSSVSITSSTQITATFTPTNSSSAGGNQTVTISLAGQSSNGKSFYVQIPTHFQFATVTGAPGGKGPVITLTDGTATNLLGQVYARNFCGVYENFAYEILDQEATPSPILNGTATVTEVFSNVTNPPGPTPSVNPISFATQGETDIQAYGETYPMCLATNQNQTLDYSFTVQIGSTVYTPVTVVYYTKGNFNGTLNVTATITTP